MKKILIVEDDSGVRELLEDFFEMLGFEVYPVANISQAYEALEKFSPFDLFILDVRLPEMDGLEFAEQIRKKYKEPIIFLTGLINSDIESQAKRIPNSRYLHKPVTLATLKKVLEELGVYQCHT